MGKRLTPAERKAKWDEPMPRVEPEKEEKLDLPKVLQGVKMRPVFIPEGSPQRSWVGDWETNTADMARQVAREFQRWLEL